MDADQQHQVCRLVRTLFPLGLCVQRGTRTGGNLSGWDDVPAEALVAAWVEKGWHVSVESSPANPPPIRLVEDDEAA